jgi:hypothetical protein
MEVLSLAERQKAKRKNSFLFKVDSVVNMAAQKVFDELAARLKSDPSVIKKV